MNKYLALVCCLASLVSARPDGYSYNLGSNGDSSGLTGAVNSYAPAASGEDGVNVGYDTGASSLGSINFLSPGYNVGAIQSGSSGFSSSGSSSSSGGLLSGGGLSGSGGLISSGGLIGGGGLISSGGQAGAGGFGYSTGRYGSGNLGLTTVNLGSLGGGASLGGGFGLNQGFSGGAASYGAIGGGQIVQQQYAPQFPAPLITKSFYVHNAPEEHDEQQIVRYVTIGRPLKNYRVVFINAPSSTSTKAKIIAQVAPVEDKTAIYVLAKKSNDLDISADVVSPAPVAPSKPDVFFIKYKTPAEALRAQRVIQSQYDQLGGTSSFSNEGTIPVQSVIGSAGESDASSYSNAQGSAQSSDISGITNIAASPVLPSGGQTNINIGTDTKPLLVPAGQSSGGSSYTGNYVTSPLVLSDSSSGASSFGGLSGGSSSFGGLSGGQSSFGGLSSGQASFGGLSGGQSSFGGLSGGQSSFGGLSGGSSSFGGLSGGSSSFGGLSGGQSSFGGLSTDQSQFDQVSSGNFQTYLPPSKYRKY